jgi:hypothetical protein
MSLYILPCNMTETRPYLARYSSSGLLLRQAVKYSTVLTNVHDEFLFFSLFSLNPIVVLLVCSMIWVP